MRTISFKIDEELDLKLEAIARRRGTTKSALVRESLELTVRDEERAAPGSCLDLASDLAGSLEAATDLSTNPSYMAGYGR